MNMNARSLLSLTLALGLGALPAHAANPVSWPPLSGDRVRLSATPLSQGLVVAEVLEADRDTLMLRIPPLTAPVRVHVDQISRIEVARGRHSQVGKGFLVGAGGVSVFMVSLLALFCEGDCSDGAGELIGKTAIAGGIAGAAVGAAFSKEVWVPVVPARPRAALALEADRRLRPQVAFTVRF